MFEFHSVEDANIHSDFAKMVRFNNGFFKSAKQSKFFLSRFKNSPKAIGYGPLSDEGVLPDCIVVSTEGSMRWCEYGRKSVQPVMWAWLLDSHGIVAQYKFGYTKGILDKKKTKTLFKRPLVTELPVFEAEPKSASEYVGSIKERVTIEGEIVSLHPYDSRFGSGVKTTIKSGENVIVHWNELFSESKTFPGFKTPLVVGDKVKLVGRVKSHTEFNDVKQTTITHIKVIPNE